MENEKIIVLIEDNPLDVEFICDTLRHPGVNNRFIVAATGEEASDYLNLRGKFANETANVPTAIILDMKLPGKSGIDILRELKDVPTLSTVPVIVLSGSKEEYHILKAHELGIRAYIVKPLLLEGLSRALGDIWVSLLSV